MTDPTPSMNADERREEARQALMVLSAINVSPDLRNAAYQVVMAYIIEADIAEPS